MSRFYLIFLCYSISVLIYNYRHPSLLFIDMDIRNIFIEPFHESWGVRKAGGEDGSGGGGELLILCISHIKCLGGDQCN